MKLLLENWRTFVKEAEEPEAVRKKGDAVPQQTIVGMRLPDLVAKLNSNQKEVMDIMLHGLEDGIPEDDKVPVKSGALKISNLTPTQNEVVIDKSLPYTLKDPRLFKE